MNKQLSIRNQSGSTIAMAMLTIVILGGFVALAIDYTNNIGRNAQRDRAFNNAVEIGDGCISEAFAAWRQYCQAASTPNPPVSTFSPLPFPTPTTANFPSFPGVTISNYSVQAVDPLMNVLPSASPPTKALGPGTGTYSYFYLASADVTLPAITGTLTAKVRRIFEKRYTSPWNWAMLYNNNLELHPSASLTLNGWVHTNQDAYLGNGTTDPTSTPAPTLTLTDRLTYQGNYSVGFDPNDGGHSGQVNVAGPTYPSDLPPGHEQFYSLFGWDTSKFNTGDSNSDNDGYRELIEKPATAWAAGTPAPNGDPFKDQRLYNQAATVVEFDANNNMTMTIYSASSGTRATYNSAPNGNGPQANAWTALVASVHPGYAFNDYREGGAVRVINFDIAQFNSNYVGNNKAPWNGIIYIRDSSAGTSVPVTLPGGATANTTKRGVRVVNGSTVPSGGMTIVSDNPVYIQGDFNSGRTASSEPPSNTGNTTDPDVSGYTRQPSSIMGDAITLLSNSWNDANSSAAFSGAGGGVRTASNTTVNAALVSGNVPSSGSNYSGGGENFVRLLEDWTGKNFTYYGSMLNLYNSTQATGLWGNANAYYPPNQSWYFDDQLSMDASNNPVTVPGYISTVAYLQQQRWYLQY